jgi:hypothetical protein
LDTLIAPVLRHARFTRKSKHAMRVRLAHLEAPASILYARQLLPWLPLVLLLVLRLLVRLLLLL